MILFPHLPSFLHVPLCMRRAALHKINYQIVSTGFPSAALSANGSKELVLVHWKQEWLDDSPSSGVFETVMMKLKSKCDFLCGMQNLGLTLDNTAFS